MAKQQQQQERHQFERAGNFNQYSASSSNSLWNRIKMKKRAKDEI